MQLEFLLIAKGSVIRPKIDHPWSMGFPIKPLEPFSRRSRPDQPPGLAFPAVAL
jgi:hypothetical protein